LYYSSNIVFKYYSCISYIFEYLSFYGWSYRTNKQKKKKMDFHNKSLLILVYKEKKIKYTTIIILIGTSICYVYKCTRILFYNL